ncbi:MAG: tyrosine-type recombinase/integrase [Oligoflexia bacterium]|nr:tyrosine-type recombinase/integrase [Oligoflexia bacterium]
MHDFGPLKGKQRSKSGIKTRHAPCNPVLLHELKELIRKNNIRSDETIFQTKDRKPMDHNTFGDRFLRDQKRWGCGRIIRFHDLRHTAATLFVAAGIDIMTVKEICGHEDIKTTMNYVHLLGDSIKNVSRMHAIIPSVINSDSGNDDVDNKTQLSVCASSK